VVSVSLSFCLSVSLSLCLSVSLSLCLSVSLNFCFSVYLYNLFPCLFVFFLHYKRDRFIILFVCPFVSFLLPVCISLFSQSPFLYLNVFLLSHSHSLIIFFLYVFSFTVKIPNVSLIFSFFPSHFFWCFPILFIRMYLHCFSFFFIFVCLSAFTFFPIFVSLLHLIYASLFLHLSLFSLSLSIYLNRTTTL
jgi:hypothetical protein